MPDDLIQQAITQAPAATGGGVTGGLIGVLITLKMFATPKDIELAKSEIRAEMAEKYVHKSEIEKLIEPLTENITYIRNRVDQIIDKR